MERFRGFVRTTVLGGIVVVLPVAILAAVFNWLFHFVTDLIQPLTDMVQGSLPEIAADGLVLAIILGSCFFIGLGIRTNFGRLMHNVLEKKLLMRFPGYSLVRETVMQFLGNKSMPFSRVVLARIFNNDTMVTAFVTDEHPNGMITVFVPTGPNPTSGNIYHLEPRYVISVDVGAEEAMRSIIGCGAGSQNLVRDATGD